MDAPKKKKKKKKREEDQKESGNWVDLYICRDSELKVQAAGQVPYLQASHHTCL
jgi:predicted RNA-binding protein (virulence factor B family)